LILSRDLHGVILATRFAALPKRRAKISGSKDHDRRTQ